MDVPAPSPADRPGPLQPGVAARVEAIVRAAEAEATQARREIEAQRQIAQTESRRYLIESRRRVELAADDRVARLRELIDELVEMAEATKQQFLALGEAIGAATGAIEAETGGPGDPLAAPQAGGASTSGAAPEPGAASTPDAAPVPGGAPGRPALRAVTPAEATRPPQPSEPPAFPARLAGAVSPPAPRPEPDPAFPLGVPPWRRPEGDTPAAETPAAAPDPELERVRLVALEMALAGHGRAGVERHVRTTFGIAQPGPVLDSVFGTGRGDSPAG